MIPDRDRKAQAPEFLKPTGKWKSRQEMIDHFQQSRDRAIAYIDKGDASMRYHFAPHPAMEVLDAYQWVLLISAHSERHTAQIREVRGGGRLSEVAGGPISWPRPACSGETRTPSPMRPPSAGIRLGAWSGCGKRPHHRWIRREPASSPRARWQTPAAAAFNRVDETTASADWRLFS